MAQHCKPPPPPLPVARCGAQHGSLEPPPPPPDSASDTMGLNPSSSLGKGRHSSSKDGLSTAHDARDSRVGRNHCVHGFGCVRCGLGPTWTTHDTQWYATPMNVTSLVGGGGAPQTYQRYCGSPTPHHPGGGATPRTCYPLPKHKPVLPLGPPRRTL